MPDTLKPPCQPPQMERKALDFALSPETLDDQGIMEGYASVAGNVDSEGDIVMPGAFAETLASGMARDGVPILLLHDERVLPVGRSLELREDAKGLYLRAQIADTSAGLDARKLVKAGILRGLSIGYIALKYDYDTNGIRRLHAVELLEVSLVTWPANELAAITAYKSAKQGGLSMDAKANGCTPEKPEDNKSKPDIDNLTRAEARALCDKLREQYQLDDEDPDEDDTIEIVDDDDPDDEKE